MVLIASVWAGVALPSLLRWFILGFPVTQPTGACGMLPGKSISNRRPHPGVSIEFTAPVTVYLPAHRQKFRLLLFLSARQRDSSTTVIIGAVATAYHRGVPERAMTHHGLDSLAIHIAWKRRLLASRLTSVLWTSEHRSSLLLCTTFMVEIISFSFPFICFPRPAFLAFSTVPSSIMLTQTFPPFFILFLFASFEATRKNIAQTPPIDCTVLHSRTETKLNTLFFLADNRALVVALVLRQSHDKDTSGFSA
ncbi:hypothetical protein P152DRAFT_72113 [Eremomyces bilateralis CBS 781.70]|uniref:Uncharacterized protein n=1 Tax=Eremomyces bilateralis CBS 781.70 TaxID=1392243 RepID=A0A6G1FYL4_9PEZI|nr:uncharacterized protein P152DRAFT_72113 [Eremomyces bilateralis CBS 781.70]KAF1810937.1 hypothetical protein P152DRAFT_72113 [Eremomyces bilateralis CBS 781.70]